MHAGFMTTVSACTTAITSYRTRKAFPKSWTPEKQTLQHKQDNPSSQLVTVSGALPQAQYSLPLREPRPTSFEVHVCTPLPWELYQTKLAASNQLRYMLNPANNPGQCVHVLIEDGLRKGWKSAKADRVMLDDGATAHLGSEDFCNRNNIPIIPMPHMRVMTSTDSKSSVMGRTDALLI